MPPRPPPRAVQKNAGLEQHRKEIPEQEFMSSGRGGAERTQHEDARGPGSAWRAPARPSAQGRLLGMLPGEAAGRGSPLRPRRVPAPPPRTTASSSAQLRGPGPGRSVAGSAVPSCAPLSSLRRKPRDAPGARGRAVNFPA